jgi:steroid 5-alpha reductase family enzyme
VTEPGQPRAALASWLWPFCTGATAVALAVAGDGSVGRRSAAGWMIGSWGARLAVQSAFAPFPTSELPVLTSRFSLLSFCLLFALPAGIATLNPDPDLSPLEFAAVAIWVVAFAGETTADRQRLRFMTKAGSSDTAVRAGVWRWLPHAHAVCDMTIWGALALFATASPWGWIAWSCPAARLYLLMRRY